MVVVQGATRARRWRGITASRDSTTTGLRPVSAVSHHHTSPRAGRSVTRPPPPAGRRPGPPLVRFVEGMRVVRGVAGVYLGCAMASQQRDEAVTSFCKRGRGSKMLAADYPGEWGRVRPAEWAMRRALRTNAEIAGRPCADSL